MIESLSGARKRFLEIVGDPNIFTFNGLNLIKLFYDTYVHRIIETQVNPVFDSRIQSKKEILKNSFLGLPIGLSKLVSLFFS